eukprot:m.70775 g.70775  ORF g.70775 m.70775 type:complete len:650 (-) comp14096_c0_seq2:254-2203(-)
MGTATLFFTLTTLVTLCGCDHAFLEEPKEFRSSHGVLNVTLNVEAGQVSGGPFTFVSRLYNGMAPGPTLRVRGGDILRVRLVNHLGPQQPATEADWNFLHSPNTTNLHLHGTCVSPEGKADNMFVTLEPGESFEYEYEFPTSHAAGTLWYHPHNHGSTALQVTGMMAGTLIVEEQDDELLPPELIGLREVVVVLQHMLFEELLEDEDVHDGMDAGLGGMGTDKDDDGGDGDEVEGEDEGHDEGHQHMMASRLFDYASLREACGDTMDPNVTFAGNHVPDHPATRHFVLANGQYQPMLTFAQGQVVRLRLVNAAASLFLEPEVNHCDLMLIALDGKYVRYPRIVRDLFLGPGNRADILIRCRSTGMFKLKSAPVSINDNLVGPMSLRYTGDLLFFEVTESSEEPGAFPTWLPTAPSHMPEWLDADDIVYEKHDVNFGHSMGDLRVSPRGQKFLNFVVNGELFSGEVKHQYTVEKPQEWTITNLGMMMNHPFHIHVNSFQVVRVSGAVWHEHMNEYVDTLPLGPGASATIRFLPHRWTGKTMLHCHSLVHEDTGMMQVVEIVGGNQHQQQASDLSSGTKLPAAVVVMLCLIAIVAVATVIVVRRRRTQRINIVPRVLIRFKSKKLSKDDDSFGLLEETGPRAWDRGTASNV